MSRFVAALLFLAPLSLFAQKYDDTVTVNVVEVPVHVERFGNPIAGLTRDDFELFVNGQPHPIEYFDVLEERTDVRTPETETAAPAPATPAELKRRRLVVLLFDIGGSSAYALQRARIKAVKYLEELQSGDTYAVATIGRRGVRFLVPFTADRVAVQRAIATLAPSEAADPFRVATLEAERGFWREAVAGGAEAGLGSYIDIWGGGPRGGFGSSQAAMTAMDSYRALYQWEEQERFLGDWQFVDDLGDLADRMAALSGVKHVVLLSERPGIADAAQMYQPVMRIHRHYRNAGVVLDAVDIKPQSAPGGTASNNRSAIGPSIPNLQASNFLYALALDTGGMATTSLRALLHRNSVTYILGFKPPRTRSKTNDIRVRVKNRRLLTDVRYRKSYTLGVENTDDDSLFLADTLLNDIPQRGMTVDLEAHGTWVAAKIPGTELLAQPSDKPVALDVYFYVFDEKNHAVAWNQLRINVDLVAGREFLEQNPYTIRQQFRLDPGRYAAKALVRVAGTDVKGFRRVDFTLQ